MKRRTIVVEGLLAFRMRRIVAAQHGDRLHYDLGDHDDDFSGVRIIRRLGSIASNPHLRL